MWKGGYMMLMFQQKFDSYSKMIKHLSECSVNKADFEYKNGIWILNIVRFDR